MKKVLKFYIIYRLPIIILFVAEERTMSASFDDIKEAIEQLDTAEEIIVFPPDLTVLKLLEALGCSTNEKGIFLQSYILKANEDILKVYKKFKGKPSAVGIV